MNLVAWPLQREDSRDESQNKDLTTKRRFLHCYFWLRGKLVEKTSVRIIFLDRCTTETFHDMRIAVAQATQLCDRPNVILGDPGATSRDNVIFSGERLFWRESLFQGLKSPWALFLTKRVPEVSKSVPLIGQKNIVLANQTRRSSRLILSPFYTKWFSSSIEREDSREEFQKKWV